MFLRENTYTCFCLRNFFRFTLCLSYQSSLKNQPKLFSSWEIIKKNVGVTEQITTIRSVNKLVLAVVKFALCVFSEVVNSSAVKTGRL